MNTAVAFIIFKRPDTTRKVFEQIRKAKPPRLYIIADGPRPNVPGEIDAVNQTREIVKEIDWPCNVNRYYSEINLGCKRRVISGLNKVFDLDNQAVVLEDDTLPHPSFFNFCEVLLDKYSSDPKVWHIGGSNFLYGRRFGTSSYWFSNYPHCWGWATWRRAWIQFKGTQELRNIDIDHIAGRFRSEEEKAYWKSVISNTINLKENQTSWVYPWITTIWFNDGLSVYPAKNLVTNIGFDQDATHTCETPRFLSIPSKKLKNLRHPPKYQTYPDADNLGFKAICQYKDVRLSKLLIFKARIFGGRIAQKFLNGINRG